MTAHAEEPAAAGREEARPAVEPDDVPARGVVYAALGLFGGIAVAAAVVAGVLTALDLWPLPPGPTPPFRSTGEQPARLEVAPAEDRLAIEARARGKLAGYAWTDAAHRHARIPIERAMEKLARQGWPDAPGRGGAP